MAASDDGSVRAWLRHWGELVAACDVDAARDLFDDAVLGFGTRADVAVGLERLVADQWQQVWPTIDDFAFDVDGAAVYVAEDGTLAVVASRWTSTRREPDGTAAPRPGRATVVLRRAGTSWRGLHTHFSLDP